MKAKKLISALAAVAVVSTSVFTFTACGHDHEYEWTVTTPATCTADGLETGTCKICGEKTTRVIEGTHEYGDWQITKMPTEYESGTAEKFCNFDVAHDHVIEVELPALTLAGIGEYSSYSKNNHITTFTYAHESGDITATTVASVEDAVALGLANKKQVLNVDVELYSDMAIYDNESTSKIFYEFGENYIHIDDASNRKEQYYTLNDDGSLFAVYLEWRSAYPEGSAPEEGNEDGEEGDSEGVETSDNYVKYQVVLNDKNATVEMMEGFGYYFTWLNTGHFVYGLENFINYLYSYYYENDMNGDAAASIQTKDDGSLVYSFSFGVKDSEYFNTVSVSFELDKNYVITNALIENTTYTAYDTDTETGSLIPPANGEYRWLQRFTVNQSTKLEEGASLPVNPYKYEDMIIKSYDMYLNGKKLEDGEKIDVNANEMITVNLENILPTTYNVNFDEITVTLTDSAGIEKVCNPDSVKLTDGEILALVSPLVVAVDNKAVTSHRILFKSLLAGEYVITVNSAEVTKSFTLNVSTVAPEQFGATVYDYVAYNQSWATDNYNTEFTVYEGQSFNFTSFVSHPMYEEAGFTVSVSGGTNYSVTDNVINGVSVKKFVASVAGDYTITLINLKDPAITAELTVHVQPAPEMSEFLNGAYFNLDRGMTFTFIPESEGAVSGTATFELANSGTANFNYSYDSVNGVTLTHTGGAFDNYTFTIEIDDAYNVYLNYMGAIGVAQRINLYNEVPNLIVGTYKMTSSSTSAKSLAVNIAGTYNISADSYGGVYYAIFDRYGKQISENVALSESIDVVLAKDQVLKVWCIGEIPPTTEEPNPPAPGTEYTVTFVSED